MPGILGHLDPVAAEQLRHQDADLHLGEVQPQAHMRAAAERHPGETVPRADLFRLEAQRIEALRLGPDVGHVMGEGRGDADRGAGGNAVAAEFEVLQRAARQ